MTEKAIASQFEDNPVTRVTKWHFQPGDETGWHVHQFDYVVVPMVDGSVRIELPDGTINEVAMAAGAPYYRQAGVEHNLTSTSDREFYFIEVEFKDRPLQE